MRFADIKRAFHWFESQEKKVADEDKYDKRYKESLRQNKLKYKGKLDAEKTLRRLHPIKDCEPLSSIALGSNRPRSIRKDGLYNAKIKLEIWERAREKRKRIHLEKQKLGRKLTQEEMKKI